MDPEIDPVSGNPVPVGAKPEEVRDDIDAKVSKGEYIIPADVVRYLGVAKIESMVKKAKESLESVLKGQDAEQEDEELPFDPSELQASEVEETVPNFAAGGLVDPNRVGAVSLYDNNNTLYGNEQDDPMNLFRRNNPNESQENTREGPTGLAGSVDQWSLDDFEKYQRSAGDVGTKFVESLVSSNPFGKMALDARYDYLNKEVPAKIDQMIESKKDLQGNPLSTDSLSKLQSMKDNAPKSANTGSVTGVMESLTGLDKVTNPIREAVQGFKERVTSPVTDPIKEAGAKVRSAVRDAVGLNTPEKTKAKEEGAISRREDTEKSKEKEDKSKDKNDKDASDKEKDKDKDKNSGRGRDQ